MKVPKAMSLDQVMKVIKIQKISIRNAIQADKSESELVKPSLRVKNDLCEHNDVILRGECI